MDSKARSEREHVVTIKFERDSPWPYLVFQCRAGEGAVCRVGGGEEGTSSTRPYPPGECAVTEWLNNSDAEEHVIGNRTSVTIPVAVERYPEGVDWRFADDAG